MMNTTIRSYRKKPVVIEAAQWNPEDALAAGHIVGWLLSHHEVVFRMETLVGGKQALIIHTLEGDMTAVPGDYIIKEPFPTNDRHFYPCKPDIFRQTYEPGIEVDGAGIQLPS